MSKASLLLRGINVSIFKGINESKLLTDISFSAPTGTIVGLTGRSGSGKSLLAKTIVRLEQLGKESIIRGEIIFNDRDILHLSDSEWRNIRNKEISIVYQNTILALNPLIKVRNQIKEAIQRHQKLSSKELNEAYYTVLRNVGLDEVKHLENAFPHQLSGGQIQRVLLAIGLANTPSILILDEITSALDKETEAKIIQSILDYKERENATVLFVSHDLELLQSISDSIVLIDNKTVSSIYYRNSNFSKEIEEYIAKSRNTTNFSKEKSSLIDNKIIEINNLKKSYSHTRNIFTKKTINPIFNDFSLVIYEGEVFGISGKSGSGKSTLVRMICGLETFDSGEIVVSGKKLSNKNLSEEEVQSTNIQIVFQDALESLNPIKKIHELLNEVAIIHNGGKKSKVIDEVLHNNLMLVGLENIDLNRYPHQYSGGQIHRICIVRALLAKPKILILDEALTNLDAITQNEILTILVNLIQKLEMTLIIISHDDKLLSTICNRTIKL